MTASLMAYVPGAHVTTMSGVRIVPDLANNRFYSPRSSAGISQFVGYASGDVTLAKTPAEMGIANVSEFAFCRTYNGNLFFPAASGSNTIQLIQLRGSDLSLVGTNFTQGASNAMLSPNVLVPMRAGRTDYVVATPFAFNLGEVEVITVPGMQLTTIGRTVESGTATLGPGLVSPTLGTAYVLGRGANVFSLYKLSMGPTTGPALSGALRTFAPADIDATWTSFFQIAGCAYDQTDNNVIIAVQTTDAVANKGYVCKLNGTTGALIWKLAILYSASNIEPALQQSSIKNGRLYMWGAFDPALGSVLFTINTVAGTFTSQRIANMGASSGVSEDSNDSITAQGDWNGAIPGVTVNYIGTYMGTLGNHIYSGWMRFFPNGPTAPLPPAPPPTPTPAPLVSVNRAWSYTLDGHTFYVLDLGAQGTFVYDQTTNQWAEFATGALPSDGSACPQWNFQNGCMWGTRIVAGDLATPTVWEMAPANTMDNDATQISHVVTGALQTRTRVYHSVEAVRVAASFGLLDSAGAVTFSLRSAMTKARPGAPLSPKRLPRETSAQK